MNFFKRLISSFMVIVVLLSFAGCFKATEKTPEEFCKLLSRKLDFVEDTWPYSFSQSGDTRFYRVYEGDNYTQVSATYNDVIIYYSYYDSIPNAEYIYSGIFERWDSLISKEDRNRFSYFDEPDYSYFFFEGISPLDELYFYGEVYYINHTVIHVYTNSESEESHREVDNAIKILGLNHR